VPCRDRCPLDHDLIDGVFDNLVRNAIEAMPSGGVITVRTSAKGPPATPRAILVSVEDTGCGMDARGQERAFDEFFTTKNAGSGLGLALVKRVVQAHGGKVQVRSAPGRGTRVQLQFLFGSTDEAPWELAKDGSCWSTAIPPWGQCCARCSNRAGSKPDTSPRRPRRGGRSTGRQALSKAGNNRTLAARILGVSRRTLYTKLDEHNLR
jgi:hypothetical protein